MCFNPKEYKIFNITYAIKIYASSVDISQLPAKDITTRAKEIPEALVTDTAPLAIGLLLFLGCTLSSFISLISLNI
jgi:hypothetical protein